MPRRLSRAARVVRDVSAVCATDRQTSVIITQAYTKNVFVINGPNNRPALSVPLPGRVSLAPVSFLSISTPDGQRVNTLLLLGMTMTIDGRESRDAELEETPPTTTAASRSHLKTVRSIGQLSDAKCKDTRSHQRGMDATTSDIIHARHAAPRHAQRMFCLTRSRIILISWGIQELDTGCIRAPLTIAQCLN